jgi:hypothetical protein
MTKAHLAYGQVRQKQNKTKQKNYINVLIYFFLFSLLFKVALSAKITNFATHKNYRI